MEKKNPNPVERICGQDAPKPQFVISPAEWPEVDRVIADALQKYADSQPRTVIIADERPAARILEDAINRAVADLEGQGNRSDRIALQLLTALALYAKEIGT